MPGLTLAEVPPSTLLLDPNNYRFQDEEDFVYAAEDRFHEESVQNRASARLRKQEGSIALKGSIIRNLYVPIERIVVVPYEHSTATKWLVIEGNRRVAAVKWILEDLASGANISPEVLKSIENLPIVIVSPEDDPTGVFRVSLMGIRHVSSIKQWGGYQRAKLIAEMRDRLGLEAAEVAERLALSTREVNRRYSAFKALEQMQTDDEFGDYVTPSIYPLMHEAVSIPIVREWLEWNDEESEFGNEDNRRIFYSLISPTNDDDGAEREAKITTYSQIRELRNILPKPEAKRVLIDQHRAFQDAIAIAQQNALARAWESDVTAAISSLAAIGIQELKNLTTTDIELLTRLQGTLAERLNDYEVLRRS